MYMEGGRPAQKLLLMGHIKSLKIATAGSLGEFLSTGVTCEKLGFRMMV